MSACSVALVRVTPVVNPSFVARSTEDFYFDLWDAFFADFFFADFFAAAFLVAPFAAALAGVASWKTRSQPDVNLMLDPVWTV